MKKTDSATEAMSRRVIDEITFQAGLLALHTAIASAGTELMNPLQAFVAGPSSAGSVHSLVEHVRYQAEGTESSEIGNQLNRSDSKGF